MPYPNFHAARIKSPELFARILVLKKMSGGIMLYGGPLKTDPTGSPKPQSYRFPKDSYTVQQAKRWLADHNIKYILFEPATDKKEFAMAVWTRKYINDLPDSAFLYVERGGEKDSTGKTTPRALRHFPYRDATGKIDLAHLRNAISRIPQSKAKNLNKTALQQRARNILRNARGKAASTITEPTSKATFGESNQFELASSAHIESDVPSQLFKKDLIRTGKYTHPIHKWVLDVTPERIDRWIASFNKMKDNGVDIEMVVDHRRDAEGVRGYVKDIFREGNILYGMIDMIGKESIDLAKTVKNVSILVDEEYKDGKENKYGESIAHVSIVQQPVAAGQSEFEVMQKAAGRNDGNIVNKYPIYYFNKGDMNMDMLDQIKKALEIEGDIDEDNVIDVITEEFQKLSDENNGLSTEVTKLKGSIEKMKKTLEKEPEGKEKEVKIDPNLAEQMGKTAEQRVTNLVAAGKLTPAARDLVVKNFIGDKGNRNLKALSIGDEGFSSLDSLIEVLETNDPVELGEKASTFAMSRQVPDENQEYDPAVTKEMVEQGSVTE